MFLSENILKWNGYKAPKKGVFASYIFTGRTFNRPYMAFKAESEACRGHPIGRFFIGINRQGRNQGRLN